MFWNVCVCVWKGEVQKWDAECVDSWQRYRVAAAVCPGMSHTIGVGSLNSFLLSSVGRLSAQQRSSSRRCVQLSGAGRQLRRRPGWPALSEAESLVVVRVVRVVVVGGDGFRFEFLVVVFVVVVVVMRTHCPSDGDRNSFLTQWINQSINPSI